jgi:hypothetical protein
MVERTAADPLDDALVGPVFESQAQLDSFRTELESSPLLAELRTIQADFRSSVSGVTARGRPYVFGSNTNRSALGRLYAVLRALRPRTLVETGVCNGVSTSVVLLALEANGAGRLYSIDFPEYADERSSGVEFWSGKGGAVVPPGREPGWLIPRSLRERWHLTIGRSQEALPPLLDRLGTIDFFFHDIEHSYDSKSFEYNVALHQKREGGVLSSDDTTWNTAFPDFAAAVTRPIFSLGESARLLIK